MKVKDLMDALKDFEDFEIEGVFVESSDTFMDVQTFKITGISDIGYSSKVIQLELE